MTGNGRHGGKSLGSDAWVTTSSKALREENARLREKVQRLRKRAGDDDLGYLFVVTYGRSGSTLVAGC